MTKPLIDDMLLGSEKDADFLLSKTRVQSRLRKSNRFLLTAEMHPFLLGVNMRKRVLSKEHREKLRIAKLRNPVRYWLGKKRDEKTNKKISLTLTGKPLSAATKNKISRRLKEIGAGRWNKGKLLGSKNPAWKGGQKHSSGYVLLLMPTHHRANKSGYVFEHIVIAEEKIKRPILREEEVHHINEIKDDNRPENLLVMKKYEHKSLHSKKRLEGRWKQYRNTTSK